ncbi:unnamed protein product [Echinostoma caproni]|uniref:Oxidored_molyb domain-containing protein n=1 Tax=Echinostoma caproni TaxID=27848 RepID=A0A183BDR1_9TREM|nr:unnamed protein product [Echinostoma caproni]
MLIPITEVISYQTFGLNFDSHDQAQQIRCSLVHIITSTQCGSLDRSHESLLEKCQVHLLRLVHHTVVCRLLPIVRLAGYIFSQFHFNPNQNTKEDQAEKQGPYANEPERHPALVTVCRTPRNAETPAELIPRSPITPSSLFFVRNHLPWPSFQANHVRKQVSIKYEDLKRDFSHHKVISTMICAGNRRVHMASRRPHIRGLPWHHSALSTGEWTGVLLKDVLLKYLAPDIESPTHEQLLSAARRAGIRHKNRNFPFQVHSGDFEGSDHVVVNRGPEQNDFAHVSAKVDFFSFSHVTYWNYVYFTRSECGSSFSSLVQSQLLIWIMRSFTSQNLMCEKISVITVVIRSSSIQVSCHKIELFIFLLHMAFATHPIDSQFLFDVNSPDFLCFS